MTGVEQLVVWLFGVLCASITLCSVARSWATGRVQVAQHEAQATVEASRAHADASVQVHRYAVEAQHGPMYVPQEWNPQEGL